MIQEYEQLYVALSTLFLPECVAYIACEQNKDGKCARA
jgi:hypothetical protein